MLLSDGPLREADYHRLRELITRKSGLQFPEARRAQLEQAIARALKELDVPDARSLSERLAGEDGRTELEDLIASVTIGETYFFRNEPQFQALEGSILPQLIERHRDTRRLRLWSAGCSSGEEPYSLAMVLDRLLVDLEAWDVTIIASDIDRAALTRASEGIYRSWSLRRTPEEVRARYFTRHDEQTWELDPRIRRMVTFRYLNLVDDAYPSLFTNIHAMDVILCRNVLIYFGDDTVRVVAEKLRSSLVDGGWLIVGHAELSQSAFSGFQPRNFPGAVVYQKSSIEILSPRRATARGSEAEAPRAAVNPAPASEPVTLERARPPADPTDSRRTAPQQWQPGGVDDAVRRLQREASQRADDPRPPYLLAKLCAGRLEMDEAMRWIGESLRRDELFAPAHYVAGLIAEEEDRVDDAISSLRRCIYADLSWPLPHFALARCFLKAGRRQRAQVALSNATHLLESLDQDHVVDEGDGLTAGRLLQLARIHKEVSGMEASRGPMNEQ